MFFILSVNDSDLCLLQTDIGGFTIKSNMKEFFSLLSLLSNATLYQHGRPSSLCDKRKGKSTTSFLRTVACEDLRCIGLYVLATLFLICKFLLVSFHICKFLLDHSFLYRGTYNLSADSWCQHGKPVGSNSLYICCFDACIDISVMFFLILCQSNFPSSVR